MDESEITTSEGHGIWGGTKYEVQLLTSSRTYVDSTRKTSKTKLRFVLAFGSDSYSDKRLFESDDARRSFIDRSFSDLHLTEIPLSKRAPREVISPLQSAVGESLSSVTFVMDYLQLGFSDFGFNMYCWPTVRTENRTLAHGDGGYKDALCALIGETLISVDEFLDSGLVLQFKNGSTLSLSLRVGRDFPCPEVAEFHGPKSNVLIIWQAGEEPFD